MVLTYKKKKARNLFWYAFKYYGRAQWGERLAKLIETSLNNSPFKGDFSQVTLIKRKERVSEDSSLWKEKDMFPGYIFIEMADKKEIIDFILSLKLLQPFIGKNTSFHPLSLGKQGLRASDLLDALSKQRRAEKEEESTKRQWEEGMKVVITSGIFEGRNAEIIKVDDANKVLSLFSVVHGKKVEIDVSEDSVRLV